MKNIAGFQSAISEVVDVPNPEGSGHPFLTVARFVFTDDKPNGNGQAVPFSEFENIQRSAIGMPVKMLYSGFGPENHEGSVPIGHIRSLETVTLPDDTHQLIAEAILWSQEYPEEIKWLKEAYASGERPGISWELAYSETETKDSISWLKNIVAMAATFVKRPAYGTRTALLALASLKEPEMKESLIMLAELLQKEDKPVVEGGKQMEEELQQLKTEAASKDAEINDLKAQLTVKDQEINSLSEKISGLEKAALIDARVRKYTDSGFKLEAEAEKADKKKALFATFTDEQFEEYLSDLVAIKQASTPAPEKAAASLAFAARTDVPKLDTPKEQLNYATLRSEMRTLARPNSIE